MLNADYAWQTQATLANGTTGRATWAGVAGYAVYQFNDTWGGTVRGEYFSDKQGFRTGVVQNWKEVTLAVTYDVPTIKNLQLRGEVRRDFSNASSFLRKNSTTLARNYQQSFAVEAVYQIS